MSSIDMLERPRRDSIASLGPDFGQRFIVTVDCEEELDWNAPFDRTNHTLTSIPRMQEFQELCGRHGVAPLWLIDYPVAMSTKAIEILAPAAREGRAEIGAHLHPWVNPPFDEELTAFNTYVGNLTAPQEAGKFRHLREAIETNFGIRPAIYRAGRYGAGPNTAAMLTDAGFRFDTSVRPHFDYTPDGGPNYRDHPILPYWVDPQRSLLELPLTTVFRGPLRKIGPRVLAQSRRLPRLPGLLARTGLLERIPLTPEGVTAAEAIRAIDVAVDDGVPLLVFSFHSPSLAPGHTPYVRSEVDLALFYDWWETIFAYLKRRKIAPTKIAEIEATLSLA